MLLFTYCFVMEFMFKIPFTHSHSPGVWQSNDPILFNVKVTYAAGHTEGLIHHVTPNVVHTHPPTRLYDAVLKMTKEFRQCICE